MELTEQEKLNKAIDTYVDAWFDGLIKSWKDDSNKESLRNSYEYVAKQAVKAHIESGE